MGENDILIKFIQTLGFIGGKGRYSEWDDSVYMSCTWNISLVYVDELIGISSVVDSTWIGISAIYIHFYKRV